MTPPNLQSPGATLRRLLADQDGAVGVAGGGTPLEALCAAAAGFEAFYVSGYATAAWRHGIPDIGLIAMNEVVDSVRAITAVSKVPVIVDADTGYGDVANVALAVRRLEDAGAAAVQIEDQVWPKKCGHMDGKSVIAPQDMVRKVTAAVLAKQNPDTVIIARTDALGPLGVREAVDRSNQYRDAGADVVFVDAPETEKELIDIAAAVPGYLVANMSESGKTPILPLNVLGDMGYKIVIYPTSALRLAAGTITAMFAELRARGGTGDWITQMMTLDDLNDLLGLRELRELEVAALDRVATTENHRDASFLRPR